MRAVFVSVKISVQVHSKESCAFHPVPQLLARIDGVMKFEALYPMVSNDEPFVPNASPIVKNLMPLDHHGAVRQNGGCRGLKNLRKMFFPQEFDQARSSWFERGEYVLQDHQILTPIVEVAEGGKHAEHQCEGIAAHKISHIFLNPLNLDTGGGGFRSSFVQEVFRSVNSRDREPPLCQGNAASAGTTAEVEDRLAQGFGQCERLLDLLLCNCEALFWKHE